MQAKPNPKRRFVGQCALALCAASLISTHASAQSDWPQRPIKWIVSQPAGAGPDILARYVAERVATGLGQAIVIENRPGGQNVIGAQAAARAANDGYTFFYGTTAAMVTNAFTFKTLPYDAEKDFAPVTLVGRSAFVIAASKDSGFKTLADVSAAAKAKPGVVAIATEGPKTFSGMFADSVAALAGIKLNHIPYTKAPDAIQDTLGGRVQLIALPEAALVASIQAGQIQPLVISSPTRLPRHPNLPTVAESFTGYEYTGWNGLFAPTGTNAAIVERMNREVAIVLRQPDVNARLQGMGSIAEGKMSPTEFGGFMKSERARWAEIVKAIGVIAE